MNKVWSYKTASPQLVESNFIAVLFYMADLKLIPAEFGVTRSSFTTQLKFNRFSRVIV